MKRFKIEAYDGVRTVAHEFDAIDEFDAIEQFVATVPNAELFSIVALRTVGRE